MRTRIIIELDDPIANRSAEDISIRVLDLFASAIPAIAARNIQTVTVQQYREVIADYASRRGLDYYN
jgi:hypothetical protein